MPQERPRQPWYSEGLCFECRRCGNCCGGAPGYVWVDVADVKAMADFLGMPAARFSQQHVRRVGMRLSLLELPDGDCEFLTRDADGKTGCAIHAVRPLQCRTWPFWESNMKSRKTWKIASRGCPGINQGEVHSLPVIEQALCRNDEARLPL